MTQQQTNFLNDIRNSNALKKRHQMWFHGCVDLVAGGYVAERQTYYDDVQRNATRLGRGNEKRDIDSLEMTSLFRRRISQAIIYTVANACPPGGQSINEPNLSSKFPFVWNYLHHWNESKIEIFLDASFLPTSKSRRNVCKQYSTKIVYNLFSTLKNAHYFDQ